MEVATPVKTAAEKAADVLGHQEHCHVPATREEEPELSRSCACDRSLAVLVAAIQWKLRTRHEGPALPIFAKSGSKWMCCRCKGVRGDEAIEDGPCAPPIDAAKAWELLVACGGGELYRVAPTWRACSPKALMATQGRYLTPEDAIAELYVRLHDADLLPEAK